MSQSEMPKFICKKCGSVFLEREVADMRRGLDLERRKKELEDELATINRRLRLERVAKRPILTYNRLVLKEDTLFWAVGYRNDIYGEGEWAIRFTPDKRRAEEEVEAIALRQEERLNPKGKIWELRLVM